MNWSSSWPPRWFRRPCMKVEAEVGVSDTGGIHESSLEPVLASQTSVALSAPETGCITQNMA